MEEVVKQYCKNNTLIITPNFPYENDPNLFGFVYNKIKKYNANGLNADIAVVNDSAMNVQEIIEYRGIKFLRTGYNQLRDLLLEKKYKKILIHCCVPKYFKILNACNIMNTQIFIYSYGNDMIEELQNVTDRFKVGELNDVKRYNERPNVKFIFISNEAKSAMEEKLGFKLKNTEIIPLFINGKIFEGVNQNIQQISEDESIKSEIKMINDFDNVEKIEIPEMKKTPTLSISIASYNVQKFIVQILCNLLRSKYADELEILVVNDGSKDNTVTVVEDFIKENYHGKKDCSVIRLIDKPNGGHGSTINKGLELATGKYFRLLDGDDYFIVDGLDRFIELLDKEDSDLIFTEYYEDYAITGEYKRTNLYYQITPYVKYTLDQLTENGFGIEEWGPLLHTTTYKTKLLQDLNFKIDEHCFYVDNEFNLMGLLAANTVKLYPLYIYSYYLGRPGQSVSPEGYKKNVRQLETVTMRIIDEYEKRKNALSDGKKKYISNHMVINLCYTMYWIVTELFTDGKEFKIFDDKLKQYPEFYNNKKFVTKRVELYRKSNGKLVWANRLINKLHR